MKPKMYLGIRQYAKMFLQHIILPAIYHLGCAVNRKVDDNLVIFADAHHTEMPFSMQEMERAVRGLNYKTTCHLHDYTHENMLKSLLHSIEFMYMYSKAKYVFVCDNFLPAASCIKREETTLVQLWHSCGLLKKMGYDTSDDIPSGYKGNVYNNYNLVTVSAPCCVPYLTSGMRQPRGIVNALGVSRTDVYFNAEWIRQCVDRFYTEFPEAKGKKILLWAPTFRGNPASPKLMGIKEIENLKNTLGSEWLVIKKVHPHIDAAMEMKNGKTCSDTAIPTEQLLPVADFLITDYSSVLFDYLLFEKPYVLFAPDLKTYEEKRGFYIKYDSLTPYVTEQAAALKDLVLTAWNNWENGTDREQIYECRRYHDEACDGHSTEKILNYLKMRKR